MKTKLTLSIDEDLVKFAHQQARSNKSSISGMFSEYLRQHKIQSDKASHPSIASVVGSLKHYPIDDSKQTVRDIYAKKYSH